MTDAHRRPCIALIVNSLDSAYQSSLRRATERVAARRGIDLWVALGRELEHENEGERALNVMYRWITSRAVDGAIVISGAVANFVGSDGIAELCHRLAPIKTCSISLSLPGIPSIILDNRAAMRTQVQHLLQHHRCKRIAYVGGPAHNEEARHRLAGYRDALEAAGVALDAALIGAGHFSLATGRTAMVEILSRTRDLDAVVAANDYMAIGAMDELIHRGLRVPEDVRVMGFDDTPVARFAQRALSTMAQPIDDMAELAVDTILKSLSGGQPELVSTLDVQLVLRESCGCSYAVGTSTRPHEVSSTGKASDYLRENAPALIRELQVSAGTSRAYWDSFLPQMIHALAAELSGQSGVFLRSIEAIAQRVTEQETSLDEVARALVQLREKCRDAGYYGAAHLSLERACLKALTVLSSVATRREGRHAIDVLERAYGLRQVSQALAMGLNNAALARNFVRALPSIGIDTAYFAVLVPGPTQRMQAVLAYEAGQHLPIDTEPYPAEQLFANGFPSGRTPSSLLLLPLSFEREVLGLVAFGGGGDAFICEAVRSQLSASLKLGALHSRVVEETALRERLARDQLQGELAVARRIQTALIPKRIAVSGLEIAAGMVPADQVGGDYYDIFSTPDGCWLAMGDVTGHGLLAGMIMLMMQTAVSALVHGLPDASPARVVSQLNRVMSLNIRERLETAEHATFVMLRYRNGGQITMAGAHEALIVHRAGEGRCERISQDGVWIGIAEDITAETQDQTFSLACGDLLVLYTDGLIEARNATGEEFGVEGVEQVVRASASSPVAVIYQNLLDAVHAWTPVQQDDVTVVVVRRLE
jgi:DNA-binding LacI/PurR family transcriptional regulator/serine phosphatase RsbU (regulator of sigma subunit)